MMRLGLCVLWCCLLAWALSPTQAFAEAPPAEPAAAAAGGASAEPIAKNQTRPDPDIAEADAEADTRIRELALQLNNLTKGKAAVAALVELGDPRVETVLRRLLAERLYLYEGRIVTASEAVEDPKGSKSATLWDLLSDEPILDEAGQPVVLRDKPLIKARQRGSMMARPAAVEALAVVRLMVKDPGIRLDAAVKVGDIKEPTALPRLREMAEADPIQAIRRAAAESVDMIVASGADAEASVEDRLAAVESLGQKQSLRGGRLIRELLRDPQKNGLPAAHFTGVAEPAVQAIDRHESTVRWLSYTFQGLSAGSILVLLALGLAITFGVMGVINMAHGEMLMIGAVTTWACHYFLSPILPGGWGNWYYVAAFPLSFLTAATVGLLVEVTIVRWLYKRPLDSLLATIGVSFVLIQAVRMWKGNNLGMSAPTWFTGGYEVMQDLTLPYNRVFIVAVTAACVLFTAGLFRLTRLGLMIRATVQDRETARTLGVNTRLVDMLTFAYGAGLAGLAGWAVVLISSVSPQMGGEYIVDSFLVVVVGGVGKLLGVVVSGLGIGFLTKWIEPVVLIEEPLRIFDSTWAQVLVLLLVIAFMQRRPAGLFPDKGRLADAAARGTSWGLGGRTGIAFDVVIGVALAATGLVLVPLLYANGVMGLGTVNKLGLFVTMAMVAVGLDLIWGYMGVLSLCQYMFFALGGYCMSIYLIAHGPMDGSNGDVPKSLFSVLSGVGEAAPPWFLPLFNWLPAAAVLGLLIPGLLALLIGVTTFRSRVRGVYFAILTQAITVGAYLIFQKTELGLGGTTGLTNFTHVAGYLIAEDTAAGPWVQTRFWLYIASVVGLLGVLTMGKWMVRSGFGRVLLAIRDDETRLLFRGYQTWVYKTAAFVVAGMFAGLGGMLYAPQKGIVNAHAFGAGESILVVAWVAIGGRGTLWGAAIGAIGVNLLYDALTSYSAELWPFVIGGLFIAVPLLLPGGVMGVPAGLAARAGQSLRTFRTRFVSTTRSTAAATAAAPLNTAEGQI